jgi:hypothetical protein
LGFPTKPKLFHYSSVIIESISNADAKLYLTCICSRLARIFVNHFTSVYKFIPSILFAIMTLEIPIQ